MLLLIWWGQRTEDPERRHDHALLSPAHPGVGAVWHIVKMCVISAVSRAVAALPDDVLRSLPMYRAYLRVEGTLHSGYMFSSVALTFMGALNAALPFAWLAPIHAVGVATQAWHMSVVSSRWMQTKAAALGAQGWRAPRMRRLRRRVGSAGRPGVRGADRLLHRARLRLPGLPLTARRLSAAAGVHVRQ